jgi:NMD protein affecting ribosome stability and mRNA decay
MTEKKICPVCMKEVEIEFVSKADVDLKICKSCGAAISILYKEVCSRKE